MTRIVAGSARGRRLRVPTAGTRPTPDRVREALFSSLDSSFRGRGIAWADVVALDLFAGSGALGLEAASRGAGRVTLVERARPTLRTLAANVDVVGCANVSVVARDVRRLALETCSAPATLVFADPPYEWPARDLASVLTDLVTHSWIAADATIVVERPESDPCSPLPSGWSAAARRTYGTIAIWYGRPAPAESADPDEGI